MKPLAFNLKEAKKVAGDKSSSTFVLKDGHQIRVAHAPLPALQRKQIEKLPVHLSEGGDGAPDSDSNTDNNPAPTRDVAQIQTPGGYSVPTEDRSAEVIPAIGGAIRKGINYINSIGEDEPAPPQESLQTSNNQLPDPSTDLPNMGAPVGVSQDNATPPPAGPNIPGLVAKGQKAIEEQADYEKALSTANASSEQSDVDARQNLLDGLKKNSEDFQSEQKKFIQDYSNGKIDPNHYVQNMSTAQKVATTIGLFLGGWGSAYTHQGNPALDFLNKQIDRDIEAQKVNLDKTKTLLGANQELYHDNILAMNATRAQMNDIYSHQMQLNAAKLGTPAAKAKADMASAQWGLQNAQLLQQNAIRATVLHSVGQGGQGLDAQSLAAAGLMSTQQAEKEQSSINSQKTAVDSTKNLFNLLNKEQTPSQLLNPQSYSRVAALNAELVNTVMNASASKRLTRESIEAEIKPLEITTRDTAETRKAKLDGVLNIIGKHADPTPVMSKYAPKALPQYPFQQATQAPQYKVGDVLYVKGQGKVQIVDPQGNFRPVK